MGRLILILGGARSGKSTYAQRLSMERSNRVLFIATAEALDQEMESRIATHKKERPHQWQTVEMSRKVGLTIKRKPVEADVVILDCLTMLVSNLLLEVAQDENAPEEEAATALVMTEIDELLLAIKESDAEWIIVSNEVGLGLVPPYQLGRLYRDLLGRANQLIADIADEVYLLIAGIPTPIHQFKHNRMNKNK